MTAVVQETEQLDLRIEVLELGTHVTGPARQGYGRFVFKRAKDRYWKLRADPIGIDCEVFVYHHVADNCDLYRSFFLIELYKSCYMVHGLIESAGNHFTTVVLTSLMTCSASSTAV